MFNNSLCIGDSNTNHGSNSCILGGTSNFIELGADTISLEACTGVVVRGDVRNFKGCNLSNRIIDKTYNGTSLIGKQVPRILKVTADFSIDGLYDIYEVDLDASGAAITCTWDVDIYPIMVTFKIITNTGLYDFKIDDVNSPSTTIDGDALPWTSGALEYDSITVYSNKLKLFII